MASVTRFIERRLRLAVDEAKSAVDRPWSGSFLGFTLKQAAGFPRAVAPKAVARFKNRVRGLTRRYRGVSLKTIVADLNHRCCAAGPATSASARATNSKASTAGAAARPSVHG